MCWPRAVGVFTPLSDLLTRAHTPTSSESHQEHHPLLVGPVSGGTRKKQREIRFKDSNILFFSVEMIEYVLSEYIHSANYKLCQETIP